MCRFFKKEKFSPLCELPFVLTAEPVGLYLHFPYCRSRCTYCDFNAYAAPEADVQAAYIEALGQDIRTEGSKRPFYVRSLFCGGGTPSLYGGEAIARILEASRQAFNFDPAAEVTLEANPGTVSEAQLRDFRVAGVNRLSFGVQTFKPELLKVLNRIHLPGEAEEAVRQARRAGFDNVSLDLMYGLPGQTLEDWQDTLRRALALAPEHLSIYQLTVEPGTRLEAQLRNGELQLPDEDVTWAMDRSLRGHLREAGFRRYEISNWSRPGRESVHNRIYWRDEPYLGLGCGATGFVDGWRIRRLLHPHAYARALAEGRSPIASAERMGSESALKDTLMMGLRTRYGVDLARLSRRYPELRVARLRRFFNGLPARWVERKGTRVRLSGQGANFASTVQLQLMETLLCAGAGQPRPERKVPRKTTGRCPSFGGTQGGLQASRSEAERYDG